MGLVGVVLFFYALAREAPRLPRAAAYAAAAFAGAIPALAFNVWAFGSPLEFAYGSAVEVSGVTGHDSLGLNDDGLFGITAAEAPERDRPAAREPRPAGAHARSPRRRSPGSS